jgi:hypothetical protein
LPKINPNQPKFLLKTKTHQKNYEILKKDYIKNLFNPKKVKYKPMKPLIKVTNAMRNMGRNTYGATGVNYT